jgi:hypothetical protein
VGELDLPKLQFLYFRQPITSKSSLELGKYKSLTSLNVSVSLESEAAAALTSSLHTLPMLQSLQISSRYWSMVIPERRHQQNLVWTLPSLQHLMFNELNEVPAELNCEQLQSLDMTWGRHAARELEMEHWQRMIKGCHRLHTLSCNLMKPFLWQHTPSLRHLTLVTDMLSADFLYHMLTAPELCRLFSLRLHIDEVIVPPYIVISTLLHHCQQMTTFMLCCATPPKAFYDGSLADDEMETCAFLLGDALDGESADTANDYITGATVDGVISNPLPPIMAPVELQFLPYLPSSEQRVHATLQHIVVKWQGLAERTIIYDKEQWKFPAMK